jgi:hypothetical protein
MYFRIDDNYFFARDISIQYSLLESIDITISMDSNKSNNDFFYNQKSKFNISSSDFTINGCFIRSISTSMSTSKSLLIVELNGDYLNQKSLKDRRNEILNELLK